MNVLSLCLCNTPDPRVVEVYWRTGLIIKGRVFVTMAYDLNDDLNIIAELSAIRYLLENRHVCGHNKAGRGLILRVTCGEIAKLANGESDKAHLSRYAQFLRTRFVGAAIEVESEDRTWVNEDCFRDTAELDVEGPVLETIHLGGFGEVELTGHAVQRYIERFEIRPDRAWHKIKEWAPRVTRLGSMPSGWRQAIKYPLGASIGITANEEIVLVVVPPHFGHSLPQIVTIYAPDEVMRGDLARLRAKEALAA
jgi:hypothetical protein